MKNKVIFPLCILIMVILTFQAKPTEQKVEPDSIDLIIRLEEKNQFRIGRVDITGNDKTKDKVIRRELYTIPGDLF